MKWFNEILTAAKSFLGLDHDATEQEVHEKLTSMKNMETMRQQVEADVRATIEAEEAERYGAQIQAEAARADTAEARATELETQLAEAGSALDAMQSMVNQLRTDAEALQARIKELEKLPAASHTDGPSAGQTGTSDKPYLNNPLYLRAKKMKGTRT